MGVENTIIGITLRNNLTANFNGLSWKTVILQTTWETHNNLWHVGTCSNLGAQGVRLYQKN